MDLQKRERRSKSATRVELNTRVEICGREAGTPAFEAQSIEVSGRGMHVRTKFLPEAGTPLVLRFEHDGQEVVVEGDVSWVRAGAKGGEFGVKFTALDSKSVIVLKELCSSQPPGSVPPPAARAAAEAEAQGLDLDEGAPVKLHIEGLAAPMKARVFEGSKRRVKVGSQLEFLKLGRALELEDVSHGERRGAHVDTVTVQVDPETQIPHLVVSVRYEGAGDFTPEPTVVEERGRARTQNKRRDQADDESYHMAADDELEADDDEDFEGAEELLKGRFALWAARTGVSLRERSQHLAKVSGQASSALVGWARGLAVRSAESNSEKPTRRTTSSPAAVSVGAHGVQRTRRSTPPRATSPSNSSTRSASTPPRTALGGALRPLALVLAGGLAVGGGFALFRGGEKEQFQAQANQFVAASAAPVAAASAFPPATPLKVAPPQPGAPQAVAANIPLFGSTQLSNLEPAPVNPAPLPGAIDEYSLSKDQAFDDTPAPATKPAAATQVTAASPRANESTVFQVGRMALPIIYRLRLDAEGTALRAEKTASGFSVLIPGRKVMENGSAITRADNRVSDVRVSQTPAGSKVTFRFAKEPSGYKVRLRNDYLEFFINQPLPTKR